LIRLNEGENVVAVVRIQDAGDDSDESDAGDVIEGGNDQGGDTPQGDGADA